MLAVFLTICRNAWCIFLVDPRQVAVGAADYNRASPALILLLEEMGGEMDRDRGYVLPLGFAMTVSMWGLAYIFRLPLVSAPSWLLLISMLAAVAFWGWFTGARSGGNWFGGVMVGATAAVLNMLILGSLLTSADGGGVVPTALVWVPGSIIVVALIAGVAAAAAGDAGKSAVPALWTALFSKVAVAATFLLVVAGGLVTSSEAGLAVVDWPNTFGSNMFLFPLARMTGGIYYEHAHRLFGALVGLTTIVLAIRLWRRDDRRWVHRLALAAVALVVLQGTLGGLRVTGNFTLSTSEVDMAPSIVLALAHGVLGQIFLGVMVALAVVTSVRWREAGAPEMRPNFNDDRGLQRWLIVTVVVQLMLGAAQRHLAALLIVHICLAAVVILLAVMVGIRAWGMYRDTWPVDRLGKALVVLASLQGLLGIAALAVTGGEAVVGSPSTIAVTITTAHQATGAVILAVSVALALWTRRLFAQDPAAIR
jgi:cytochrome c oxidase assembly protein subunit 15